MFDLDTVKIMETKNRESIIQHIRNLHTPEPRSNTQHYYLNTPEQALKIANILKKFESSNGIELAEQLSNCIYGFFELDDDDLNPLKSIYDRDGIDFLKGLPRIKSQFFNIKFITDNRPTLWCDSLYGVGIELLLINEAILVIEILSLLDLKELTI